MTARLQYARSFPVAPDDAYARTVPVPLESILGRRHLAIPGIAVVEGEGVWGESVGQTRTLHFTDGGRVRERLTRLDPPRSFAYTLDQVRGPMALLFASVDGTWAFEPLGTGTRITWSWGVAPTAAGRLALPAFAPMWRGTARRAFDRLETHLLA